MLEVMLLINNKNKTGTRIDIGGTPELTSLEDDLIPLIDTTWDRFDRNASIHFNVLPLKP
jgi:hypothetical protein